jgi:hypothetical protein
VTECNWHPRDGGDMACLPFNRSKADP